MSRFKFRCFSSQQEMLYMKDIRHLAIAEFEMETNIEWMQYTGLNDKNGVEIFEGDILAYGEFVPERVVIFENGAFRLSDDTNQCDQALVTDTAKRLLVIGNKYSNPELLEVK